MDNKIEHYKVLRGIQLTLAYLANSVKEEEYSTNAFYSECVNYLKECQRNHLIPKDINIDKEVYYEYAREDKILYVNFSEKLENYLTDKGQYIAEEFITPKILEK